MKPIYPTIQCYTPDFDLEQLLGEDYLKRRAEKYIFIVHSIMYQALRNKKQFSGFVNLNAKLLEYFIGPKFYKETLSTLFV